MVINEPEENHTNLTELTRLRDLGRYYLQRDMVARALETYASLLEKFPDDVSTMVIIGDAYLMAGDTQAAGIIYRLAAKTEPQRIDIQQRLSLADTATADHVSIAGGFPPLHPQAINRLAESLTGHSLEIDEGQVKRAADLLEKTMHSDSPAESVSEHLDEIDALLPAILELNIRQARSQGRVDLAAELIDLQRTLISNTEQNAEIISNDSTENSITVSQEQKAVRAILIGEPSMFSPLRLPVMQSALEQSGTIIETRWENISLPWEGYDLVIAHNPHGNPVFMKALAAWAGSGNPVVMDLDTDFRILPSGHPASRSLNNTNLADPRTFTAALQLSDILVFPSSQAALKFSDEGYQAYTIPDGWSMKNSLWTKTTTPSARVNLGIFTEPGNLENVASIRRVVIRILREFPQTRLVVSGDPEAYQLFDSIPDTRRIYLPPTEPEDHPFLLAQADIHLFPIQTMDEVTRLEGDRKYLEAGVRKAAWVGSPLPAAEEWHAGGLIARSVDDWYSHLKTLITDTELRSKLAMDGFEKAGKREARQMAAQWSAIIQKAIHATQSKPFPKEGK